MIFGVIRMAGVVKVGISVTVVGGIDQEQIIGQIPHKADGVGDNVLKAGLVPHHVMGVHVIGHIVQIGRTVEVRWNAVGICISVDIAFADTASISIEV